MTIILGTSGDYSPQPEVTHDFILIVSKLFKKNDFRFTSGQKWSLVGSGRPRVVDHTQLRGRH